jgi:hypothetical protein
MNAAEDNDIRIGVGGPLTQAQRIADKISDILNRLDLVVVCQDNRIPLFFEALDFGCQVD